MRILALAALAALAFQAPALAGVGRIKNAGNGAFVERAGEKLPARPGLVLEKGDALVAPRGAKLGATFIDNMRIAIAPGSRLSIETFEYNDTTAAGEARLYLQRGTSAVVAGRIARSGKQALQIRTRNALFNIRNGRVVVKAPQ